MMEARRVSKGLDINTGRTFTPAEAQAMLARLVANPIPVTNGSMSLDSYFSPTMGYQRVNFIPGKPGYHIEDPRVEDQQAKPEKPEVRYASASTYGRVIPISLGRRRLEGNLIQCSNLVPRIVGTTTKTIEYEVPIYEDPPVDDELGFTLDDSGGNDPTGTSCGTSSGCDTRSPLPPGDAILGIQYNVYSIDVPPNEYEGGYVTAWFSTADLAEATDAYYDVLADGPFYPTHLIKVTSHTVNGNDYDFIYSYIPPGWTYP